MAGEVGETTDIRDGIGAPTTGESLKPETPQIHNSEQNTNTNLKVDDAVVKQGRLETMRNALSKLFSRTASEQTSGQPRDIRTKPVSVKVNRETLKPEKVPVINRQPEPGKP